MRPLFFDFPNEKEAWTIDDQFMYGSQILVAPVLVYQARNRSVYFPRGKWEHWFTKHVYLGPVTTIVDAPLLEFPLFKRVDYM